ncbi:MAG: hypothetical protein ACI9FN_003825 [Saprospiraceae bacterium]|jgi:hypothetical protein
MKIDEIVAVSGLPGLYKAVTSRNNGMIIEDIDTQKSRFASIRKHQFTPLATVAIYTDEDATEINEVFSTMLAKEEALPIPEIKSSSSKDLFKYFAEILPEYDTDRVLISDVKKVLKWYLFLRKRELFPFEASEEVSGEEE